MPTQLSHKEITNPTTNKEIVVVADEIRSPANVGMILRISEAFGSKEVIFLGDSPTLENRKVKRTSRSAEKGLSVSFNQIPQEIFKDLRARNFKLIGIEITDNSSLLKDFNFETMDKVAVFIGNEKEGVSSEILKEMEAVLHFELFGDNTSINVVNALSVALYEVTR
ncbi:MAG: TrmH family RNA methyltransferase [Flavobacteriales bacterium]